MRAMVRLLTLGLLAPAALGLSASSAASAEKKPAEHTLLLATTTSVRDSGLLDVLLPRFLDATGIHTQAVAVGTGAALRMGKEGNADLLLVHAPAAERPLVESGVVTHRHEFMENYFVLAGPEADPASVRKAGDVLEALRRIRKDGAPFVSRGDDSGTHKREKALFKEAGLAPDERWPALTRTGAGMGLSLQVAGQKKAYILSDIGTFLAFRERTGLVALTREEPGLRNVYSLLPISKKRFPRTHAEAAAAFEAFIARPETRDLIAHFGLERFGRPLFKPLSLSTSATGSDANPG